MSAIGWISVVKVVVGLSVIVLGVHFAVWWLVVAFGLMVTMDCGIIVGESNPWWR